MNFFSRIAAMIKDQYSLQLTIQVKENKMSVSIIPKAMDDESDFAKNTVMQPVVVSGNPDEIDQGFLAAIAEPIGALNGLVVHGNSFVKEVKKEEKKTSKPLEKNEPEKKEEKPKEPDLFDKKEEKPKEEPVKKEDSAVPLPDEWEEAAHDNEQEEEEEKDSPLDEDSGDDFPSASKLEDEEEKPTEPDVVAGQEEMFNDEDW